MIGTFLPFRTSLIFSTEEERPLLDAGYICFDKYEGSSVSSTAASEGESEFLLIPRTFFLF